MGVSICAGEERTERMMTQASKPQPKPNKGEQVVVDIVLTDIRERAETGKRKYGTYLETNNGRNALWDAYQEAIDLVMYLRQALLEQDAHAVAQQSAQADGGQCSNSEGHHYIIGGRCEFCGQQATVVHPDEELPSVWHLSSL